MVRNDRRQSLNDAWDSPLQFHIPISDVTQANANFQLGRCACDVALLGWMERWISDDSEMAVMSADAHWLHVIASTCTALVYRDQVHASSVHRARPDATVCVNDAVIIKHEAKASPNDLYFAEIELSTKLNLAARMLFPEGSLSIIGITSSRTHNKIFRLDYDPAQISFSTVHLRTYEVSEPSGRIAFLIDIIKLCRWFITIQQPNQRFHLVPGVRTKTTNNHFITWTERGLLKEFRTRPATNQLGGQVTSETTESIRFIHGLRLPNVEHGVAVENNDNAVLITRIGRRALDALRLRSVTVEQIIDGVRAGMQQLHDIGLAHCDISLSNVFVDGDNVVFLDDLEYLTPVDYAPPHLTRIPEGVIPATARDLDNLQFQEFVLELNRSG